MSIAAAQPQRPSPASLYENAAEWLHALGDIPPERIVMNPPPGTATEHDLLTFVERDKRLVELVDGTLVEKPVGYYESLIAAWLITQLNVFVGPRGLGLVAGADGTFRMVSGRIRLPDVSFVSMEDLPGGAIPTEPVPRLTFRLAVEVLSKGNTQQEMREKRREYFESGTRLVWAIDPVARQVAVFDGPTDEPAHVLFEFDVLDGGEVLPGFHIKIADMFAVLPKQRQD